VRNLLRCRRGSVAFATVIALVPLIGVVALGAEAGSWYVTKQNAQNAADAAAYSGGLTLACSISGSTNCDTAQTYVDRGKQFAAQNGFCNAGDSLSGCALPTGTSRTVQIDQPTANRVRAVVSQQQPAYLAAVLGLSTVNIGAQAIVEIKNPKDLCALGLGPDNNGLTIGGSSNITGNGCGLMSDTAVKYNSTPTFSGSGWAVNGVNGCVASAGHCALSVPYNYNMLPATNPLAILDGTNQSFNSWTSTGSPNDLACSGTLTPNNSTNLYRKLTCTTGDTVTFSPGTYFFYNGAIKINGGTVNGTGVTLVLLGDSSLSISGGTVNLSAPAINSTSSALNGVLIDDQAPSKSSNNVTINGSTVSLGGAMYFPNVDVTWGGNVQNTSTTCTEVIAKTLTINGNAYLSTANCAPGTVAQSQVVALVQ
jgi:Flp pilus assembly protein TadG